MVEEPPRIVDQSAAVRRPVRGLPGVVRSRQHLPVPALDLEDLEKTAQIVPVLHQGIRGRIEDADIGEFGLFVKFVVVGTDEKAGQQIVLEVHIFQFLNLILTAEPCR